MANDGSTLRTWLLRCSQDTESFVFTFYILNLEWRRRIDDSRLAVSAG
jgi:hypothetical protein